MSDSDRTGYDVDKPGADDYIRRKRKKMHNPDSFPTADMEREERPVYLAQFKGKEMADDEKRRTSRAYIKGLNSK